MHKRNETGRSILRFCNRPHNLPALVGFRYTLSNLMEKLRVMLCNVKLAFQRIDYLDKKVRRLFLTLCLPLCLHKLEVVSRKCLGNT